MADGTDKLLNIIYTKVDNEQRTVNRCDEVSQELARLNKGIQSCLEMASDAIGNQQIRSKIKTLETKVCELQNQLSKY